MIPAALARGEHAEADGARFLTAIVAGYEVATAVGEELADAAIERGFRAASIFGALGAAAAGAVAAGLDEDRSAHAIALAASFAAGLAQTWTDGAEEWSYQLGLAARSGVTATLLARSSINGARFALEGASGFARGLRRHRADAVMAGAGGPRVAHDGRHPQAVSRLQHRAGPGRGHADLVGRRQSAPPKSVVFAAS